MTAEEQKAFDDTKAELELLKTKAPPAGGGSDELKAQLEKLTKENETIKNSQSGSDKKVSELQAELEATKKNKMTTEEAKAAAIAELTQKITNMETQLSKSNLSDIARTKLKAAGISDDYLSYVNGDSEAVIEAKVNALKVINEKAIKAQVEERIKGSGGTPNPSKPTPPVSNLADLEKQYDAESNGDKKVAIMAQIRQERIREAENKK